MEEAFMSSIMKDLNSNLAVNKRTLEQMMDSGDYTYRTRDGSVVDIPAEQMQFLWGVCDDSQRISLRLPIYVSTDISGEGAAWKVDGRVEAPVVAAILGKRLHRDDNIRLYHPELKDLRAKIPDCVMIVFTP